MDPVTDDFDPVPVDVTRLVDSRRFFLAGYLSALPEFRARHPETLLGLADQILAALGELADA